MSGNELRTQEPEPLKAFLFKHHDAIQQVAAEVVTVDRMVRLACAAASREPKLAQCQPLSILRSLMQAAELGLEVCSGKNEAFLIPRYNKNIKGLECTFLPGFQGLIKLAVESGKVRNVEARVVYAKDTFCIEQGTAPCIKHSPSLDKDRGDILAFYAVAFMPDGSTQFEVMPKHEVDAIMERAKDGNDGFSPWKSDYAEMGRKTVVRRLSKYLPKTARFAKALEIQAKSEAGEYDLEPTAPIRPGDANPPYLDIEGWTEVELSTAKASCDEMMERLLESGMDQAEAEDLMMDRRMTIGVPDLSPNTWTNRFLTFRDRHLKEAVNG